MLKRNFYEKRFKAEKYESLNDFCNQEFNDFNKEIDKAKIQDLPNEKRKYYVTKSFESFWLLAIHSSELENKTPKKYTLKNSFRENKLRIHKHHFYFDITIQIIESQCNSILFEYSKREIELESIQVNENEIFILKDYFNGIKPITIEELIKFTIDEFCNEMSNHKFDFIIKNYNYHYSDSTDIAVYLTTLNCLAELFDYKEKGVLILNYKDLK